jgi:hypothetical protein
VPTVAEYSSGEGYYIRAKPPQIGFVTYQVTPAGNRILEKLDCQDGDELGWNVVNTLRELSFVYTQNSGIDDQEGLPEDSSGDYSISGLSEAQRKTLITELIELPQVDSTQVRRAAELIHPREDKTNSESSSAAPPDVRAGNLEEEINARLSELVDRDSTSSAFFEYDELEMSMEVKLANSPDKEYDIQIHTDFGLWEEVGRGYFIFRVEVDQSEGIQQFVVKTDAKVDWEFRAEIYKLMGDITPLIASALNRKKFRSGSARDNAVLKIEQF